MLTRMTRLLKCQQEPSTSLYICICRNDVIKCGAPCAWQTTAKSQSAPLTKRRRNTSGTHPKRWRHAFMPHKLPACHWYNCYAAMSAPPPVNEKKSHSLNDGANPADATSSNSPSDIYGMYSPYSQSQCMFASMYPRKTRAQMPTVGAMHTINTFFAEPVCHNRRCYSTCHELVRLVVC